MQEDSPLHAHIGVFGAQLDQGLVIGVGSAVLADGARPDQEF